MLFKFSREKLWLEPPCEKLRKQLEEELRLSGTNLKSHAWYHGPIPWEGGFILTCRWENKTIHFPIRKMVAQSSETYSQAQYSLEGEAFDSIPSLVHYYMGSRMALMQWSRAQINQPVNRTLPLSFLETVFSTTFSPPSNQREIKEDGMRDKVVCPSRWRFTLNIYSFILLALF
ncbi:hypothetical protein XENOCAPTIV_002830 [Xenoophorus captivus]|uniref:SH2 domain-containing protein n=1 Tax=Xenoophorus captivus TaxID=1517983 RepID=A0ABV0RWL6_9TELE